VRKPQLVDAVIVVDIAPKFYPVHHEAYISAMKRVDFTAAKSRRDIEAVLSQTLTSPGIIQFFMKSLHWKTKEELAWRFNLDALERELSNVGEALEYGYFDGPTLFIAGGQSGYITADDRGQNLRALPERRTTDPLTALGIGCTQKLAKHSLNV
jgi:pimeloyl-ACP methyl ester carboxylesterase